MKKTHFIKSNYTILITNAGAGACGKKGLGTTFSGRVTCDECVQYLANRNKKADNKRKTGQTTGRTAFNHDTNQRNSNPMQGLRRADSIH